VKPSKSRIVVKNIVIAVTLCVAALATLAVTHSKAPLIEAVALPGQNG
jgi:hypothetical protein